MKKLNMRGFSHEFVLVAFVVIFSIIGVGYLVASRADTSSTAPELNSNAKNFKSQGVTPLHTNERPIQFYAKGSGGGKKGGGTGGGTTTSYGTGPLTYNGGFVLHNPTVRAIYWVPAGYSVSANYASTIDGFLKNVAGSKGTTDNVFYSDTQYTDANGAANPYFAFGGSVVDTNPYPANACSVTYSSVCLNDTQVNDEITKVAAAQGWPSGPETIYVMMVAKGVGECANSGYCAFTGACGWHHDPGYQRPTAYIPYAAFSSGCSSGQSPNHDDADQSINTLSHELNELITDAPQSSWYDTAGYEDGDKCAWLFGTILGGNSGAYYNQVIGTGQYFLQSEFSNSSSKCVTSGV